MTYYPGSRKSPKAASKIIGYNQQYLHYKLETSNNWRPPITVFLGRAGRGRSGLL